MTSIPVYKAGIHSGEERIVPGNERSGMVFFSGCHLACNFCYTPETSVHKLGESLTPTQFRTRIDGLIAQGARNINLISPTHVWYATESLLQGLGVPLVLKISGYESRVMINRMARTADFFVPDFKVFDSGLAKQVGLPFNYGTVARAAIETMMHAKPTLVRHLMMPGAFEDSRRIVSELAEMKFNGHLNLMTHFISPLGLKVAPPGEVEALASLAAEAGISVLVNGRTARVAHVA